MNIRNHIAVLSLLSALTACQNDGLGSDWEPSLAPHYLYISKSSLSYDASTDLTQTVSVKSVGTPWQFTGMPAWLSASPASGNSAITVLATAKENTSAIEGRTAVFAFTSTDADYAYRREIIATQAMATPYIRPSVSTLSFTAAAGSQSIGISSNCNWTAACSESWVTLTPSADKQSLTVTVSEYTDMSYNYHTAYIHLDYDGKTYSTIKIGQNKPAPSADPSKLTFDNAGGTYQLVVDSEVAWTADTSDPVWLQVSPAQGRAGKTTVVIEATPNSSIYQRTGYVCFYVGGKLALSTEVGQKGISLSISPTSLTFAVTGEHKTIDVQANTAWSVTEKPDWLTLSATEGRDTTTLTLTASANSGVEARTGKVVVTAKNSSLKAEATVSQQGLYFTITPTSQPTFTSHGGTHKLSIATNEASWTGQSSATWLTLSPTTGTGSIDVVMTAADNASTKDREATATFTPKNLQPVKFVARQAARYLRADATAFTFFSKGGTSDIVTISTDATYTITSSAPSWLTISQSGNTFTATAKENTTGADREAVITIAMTGLMSGESYSLKLPVVQKQFSPGVDVTPFGEEEQWELTSGSGVKITVTGFGADEKWD